MRGAIRFVTLLAIAIFIAAPVFADNSEPVTLALKFANGDAVTYDVAFSGAGSLTGPDRSQHTLTIQGDVTLSERVREAQSDGSGVVEMLMPHADVSIGIMGKSARFTYADGKFRWFTDGKEQTPPQQLSSTKLPLFQTPILVTLTPDGRLTGFDFADQQFVDLIRKAAPGFDQALPNLNLNTAALFPDHPVKIGETWTRNVPIPVGALPGLTATCKVRHTLESVMGSAEQSVAKITGYTETTLRLPSFSAPGQQGLTMSIPQLRHTIASTEFFSTTAGRLVQASYDINFSTKLSASAQGRSQSGSVDARIIVSVISH